MAEALFGKPHLRLVITRDDPSDPQPNGPITLIVTCPHCEKEERMRVPSEGAHRWHFKGELIQHAFPEMSKQDRERLVSGVCGPCWEELERFAEEEGVVT